MSTVNNMQYMTTLGFALGLGLSNIALGDTDWDYPEDIPVVEPVTVGLAGEKPADIVRYLMALGAMSVEPSPDGSEVAFSYRITGEPQLWLVDSAGGWPRKWARRESPMCQ